MEAVKNGGAALRLKLQHWLRFFLGISPLRDAEERHYRDLLRSLENAAEVASQGIHHDAQMLAALSRIEGQQAVLQAEMMRVQTMLEPVAKRNQMEPVRVVADWDEVQRQNLQEFEDKQNGIHG